MYVCEVGHRISAIIVFVSSCVILTAILVSNPLNCVFTIFLRRNMHLKLYYCMEFSWDQYASCSIILLGGSKPPLKQLQLNLFSENVWAQMLWTFEKWSSAWNFLIFWNITMFFSTAILKHNFEYQRWVLRDYCFNRCTLKKPLHKLIIRNHLKILVVSTGLVFDKKFVFAGFIFGRTYYWEG